MAETVDAGVDIHFHETGADRVAEQMRKMQAAALELGGTMKGLESGIGFLKTSLISLGLVFGTKQIYDQGKAWDGVSKALKAVSKDADDYADTQQKLKDFSTTNASDLTKNIGLYSALAKKTKEFGATSENLLVVLSAVNQENKGKKFSEWIGGLTEATISGEKMKELLSKFPEIAALVAQGMGTTVDTFKSMVNPTKEVVRNYEALGDGFIRVEKNGAPFANTLHALTGKHHEHSQAMRGTFGPMDQLKHKMSEGTITTRQFWEALARSTGTVQVASSKVSNSLTILKNVFMAYAGEVGDATNKNKLLANAILLLAQYLIPLIQIMGLATTAFTAFKVGAAIDTFFRTTAAGAYIASVAMSVFTTTAVTTSTVSLTLSGALAFLSGAFRALWAAMLANPFTALLTVLALAATALYFWGNSIEVYGITPLGALTAALNGIVRVFTYVSNVVIAFAQDVGGMLKKLWTVMIEGEGVSRLLTGALTAFAAVITLSLLPALVPLTLGIAVITAGYLLLKSAVQKAAGDSRTFGEIVRENTETLKANAAALGGSIVKAMQDATAETKKGEKATGDFNKEAEKTPAEMTKFIDKFGGATTAVKQFNDGVKTTEEMLKEMHEGVKKVADEVEKLSHATRNAFGQIVTVTDEWARRSGAYFNTVSEGLKKSGKDYDGWASQAESASDRVIQAQNDADMKKRMTPLGPGGSGVPGGSFQDFSGTLRYLNSQGIYTQSTTGERLMAQIRAAILRHPEEGPGIKAALTAPGGVDIDIEKLMSGASAAVASSGGVGGFANGGSFRVGGSSGIDQNLVQFLASRDELVTVQTPAQQRAGSNGGGRAINVQMNVVTRDADSFRRSEPQIMTSLQGRLRSASQQGV